MKCKFCGTTIPENYKSIDGQACEGCDKDIYIALKLKMYHPNSSITPKVLIQEGYLEADNMTAKTIS